MRLRDSCSCKIDAKKIRKTKPKSGCSIQHNCKKQKSSQIKKTIYHAILHLKNKQKMTNSTVSKIITLPLTERLAFLNTAIKNNTADAFEQKIIDEILNDNITSWVISAAVKEYKRVIDVVRQHEVTKTDLIGDFLIMAQKFQKTQKIKSDAVSFALVVKLQEYYTR